MTLTAREVQRIRERLGLTQQQLADALGVSRESVNKWEAGTKRMSEPTSRLLKRMDEEGGLKAKKRMR